MTVQVPSDGGSAGASGTTAGAEVVTHSNSEPLVAPVTPPNNQPMPAVDKPAEAPEQVNEVQPGSNAQVNTGANASGKPAKKKKAPYDKKDESSSKHKKKQGLDKLNPF